MNFRINRNAYFSYLVWVALLAWLYSLSFLIQRNWDQENAMPALTQKLNDELRAKEQDFLTLVKAHKKDLEAISRNHFTSDDLRKIQRADVHLFLFDIRNNGEQPFFWSTHEVSPAFSTIRYYRSGQLMKFGNGYYEMVRVPLMLNARPVEAVGLILVYRQYIVSNEQLSSGFPWIPRINERLAFCTGVTPNAVMGIGGLPLFYVKSMPLQPVWQMPQSVIWLRLGILVLIMVVISRLASRFIRAEAYLKGILSFFSLFFILMWLCGKLDFPIDMTRLAWFYARNPRGAAEQLLGLSFFDIIFLLWMVIFLLFHSSILNTWAENLPPWRRKMLALAVTGIAVTVHILMLERICDFYQNTSLNFDFRNFLNADYYTILAFLVIFLGSLTHLYFFRFYTDILLVLTRGLIGLVIMLFAGGCMFLLFFDTLITFKIQVLFSLIWVVGFMLLYRYYPTRVFPINSMRLAWSLFAYAIGLGFMFASLLGSRIQHGIYESGKLLMLQHDPARDQEMQLIAKSLEKLNWPQIILQAQDSTRRKYIADSLTGEYFGSQPPEYAPKFYWFTNSGIPYYAATPAVSASVESLNMLFYSGTHFADLPVLSAFDKTFDQSGYIFRIPVSSGEIAGGGLVFIVVPSDEYDALKELSGFRHLSESSRIDLPSGYGYAWYKSGRLKVRYTDYEFPSVVPDDIKRQQQVATRENKGHFETWFNVGGDYVLLVVGQFKRWELLLSRMAYLYGFFLIFYFLIRVTGGLVQYTLNAGNIFRNFIINISNKIRFTIIGMLTFSFVLVLLININFFINRFEENVNSDLAEKADVASRWVTAQFHASTGDWSARPTPSDIRASLSRVSENLDIDINLYDSSGNYIGGSQPWLFSRGVLGTRINPVVYYQLIHGREQRQLQTEYIGMLSYKSMYQTLYDSYGRFIAYMQIPYFTSQRELKEEISNFIIIVLNIVAFVFFISGGIALAISGSISRSFSVITDSMNKIRLSEKIAPIEWSRKDEIGVLVDQYNDMVKKLEGSVAQLAQNERELAWRDMARQVAHEIKNPLTPMKLSLQYLQKAILENRKDLPDLSSRVASNLVVQIDHLSRIAFEFSEFANIGQIKIQQFDLHQVLLDLLSLYEMQDNIRLNWERLPFPIMLEGDITQMNRLLANLIKNAAESGREGQFMEITIREKHFSEKVQLSIQDNGQGISTDVQRNIFKPNFTTKSGGTGLGLAMSKAIVERAGGSIWFETGNTGTTFFIELPLRVETLQPANGIQV